MKVKGDSRAFIGEENIRGFLVLSTSFGSWILFSLADLAEFKRWLTIGYGEPFSRGDGKTGRQQDRDKLIKKKGTGKKDFLRFLSQDPCHQAAAGPGAPGKGSAAWVACKGFDPCLIFQTS